MGSSLSPKLVMMGLTIPKAAIRHAMEMLQAGSAREVTQPLLQFVSKLYAGMGFFKEMRLVMTARIMERGVTQLVKG